MHPANGKMHPDRIYLHPINLVMYKSAPILQKSRVVRNLNFYYVFTTFGVHDMPAYAKIGAIV